MSVPSYMLNLMKSSLTEIRIKPSCWVQEINDASQSGDIFLLLLQLTLSICYAPGVLPSICVYSFTPKKVVDLPCQGLSPAR